MAFQTCDVVDAMAAASGTAPAALRIDGGASVMDLLCQVQADLLDVTVERAAVQETTALGAAYLAGIAEGVWASADEAAAAWRADATFTPNLDAAERTRRRAEWSRAVERARGWAK